MGMKSRSLSVNRETLYGFRSHPEDAFLLQTVAVATDSEKRRQATPRKVYPADPAPHVPMSKPPALMMNRPR